MAKTGRNDPCPCGSGKKYGRCHGVEAPFTGMVAADLPFTPNSEIADANPPSNRRVKTVTHLDIQDLPKGADPCPCESGKAFAACHLPIIRDGQEMAMRMEDERLGFEEQFGEVRPPIHANYRGHKVVAVWNELFFAKDSEVKTFPDFLMRYIATCLNPEWGKAEILKPLLERHTIMQWYDALCRQQRRFQKGADGVLAFVPDGLSMAYMLLAYDLYVLRHHGVLQKRVISRLKNRDQFQGARYELFATATCIRAGFDIHHEKETDGSRTHPEFTATHRQTGEKIALEAKSRQRPGVLSFRPEWPKPSNPKADVRGLLVGALEKDVDAPLVAFIDVNLPPSESDLPEEPWFREVVHTVTTEFGYKTHQPEPFNLMVFTNHPYHYGEPGRPVPARSTLNFWSDYPRRPATHPESILRISEEAAKWGLIPNEFPP
jgi:SEC-C motif